MFYLLDMIDRDTMPEVVEIPFEGGRLAFITDGSLKEPNCDAVVVDTRTRSWAVIDGAGETTGKYGAEILSRVFFEQLAATSNPAAKIDPMITHIKACKEMKRVGLEIRLETIGAAWIFGQKHDGGLQIGISGDCEGMVLDLETRNIINIKRSESRWGPPNGGMVCGDYVRSGEVNTANSNTEVVYSTPATKNKRVTAYSDGIYRNCDLATDIDIWLKDPAEAVCRIHAKARANAQAVKDKFFEGNPKKVYWYTDPTTDEIKYRYRMPVQVDHMTLLVCDFDE